MPNRSVCTIRTNVCVRMYVFVGKRTIHPPFSDGNEHELAQGKVRGKWRRSTSPLSRQRPWCSE